MPKIRLSALAVDMKGKAGGSVFSRNAGGVYFRNNKTGGGKKSAAWDKQKANLSAISRSWKSLTPEQQDEWSAAAAEYPARTVWGDSRQPSGYELYSRLNGVLKAARLPVLTSPLSPRSLLDPGDTELIYPDLVQFQPQRWLNFADQPTSFGQAHATLPFSAYNRGLLDAFTYHIRVSMDLRLYAPTGSPSLFSIFSHENLSGSGHALLLTAEPGGLTVLEFRIFDGSSFAVHTVELPEGTQFQNTTFTVTMEDGDPESVQIFIDGALQVLKSDTSGILANSQITQPLVFGSISTMFKFFGYLSDFRLYDTKLTPAEVALISNNYLLNTEYLIVPFTKLSISNADPITDSECDDDAECGYGYMCIDHICQCVNTGESPSFDKDGINNPVTVLGIPFKDKALSGNTPSFVPTIELVVENENLAGTYLQVYASPPMSAGVTSRTANLKLLGTFPYGSNKSFPLTEAYRSIYGSIPGGASVQFFYVVVDSQTGVSTAMAKPKKPTRTRFKAGAELSSAVN